MLLTPGESTNAGKVLLARPHPLIVDHMRDFLTANGFLPTTLEDMDALSALAGSQPAGIVVSTSAVVSDSKLLFRDVLKLVRSLFPETPILIPTLVSAEKLQQTFSDLDLMAVEACTPAYPGLGSPECLLVAQRDDFIDPVRQAHAGAVVRMHFRSPAGYSS